MASNNGNRWKGLVLGFFGGITGMLAMRVYWQQVQRLTGRDPRKDYDESDVPDTEALDAISLVGQQKKKDESTTAAMGRLVYEQFTGEEPGEETKSVAYPPQMHLHTWGAHVAYGLASALATQLLYRLTP